MSKLRNINLSATGTTPEVTLNRKEGTAFLLGRCLSSDPTNFFKPLIDWATAYEQNPQPVTMVVINADYINSGSSLCLRQFLGVLSKIQFRGRRVIVKWYYEEGDTDIRDLAIMIAEITKLKIQLEEAA